MTETIFAIAILFSLVALGGLISVGNERQRKAIDKLSEHAQSWAIEDLRLKRGQIEESIAIEDPVAWLSTAASRSLDKQIKLTLVDVLENPVTLSCIDKNTGESVFFSLFSPKELRILSKEKRSELSKRGAQHPLIPLQKSMSGFEMNILNAGIKFDLELPFSWHSFTEEQISRERLWGYVTQN